MRILSKNDKDELSYKTNDQGQIFNVADADAHGDIVDILLSAL